MAEAYSRIQRRLRADRDATAMFLSYQAVQHMIIGMIFGIGPALAPVLGGWLLLLGSWHLIFWFLCLFGAALALEGFVAERLQLFRTFLTQVAAGFATLVSPPTLGTVAVNVRYLQREKVPAAAAAASHAIRPSVVNADPAGGPQPSARASRFRIMRCTRSSGPWGRLQCDQGST